MLTSPEILGERLHFVETETQCQQLVSLDSKLYNVLSQFLLLNIYDDIFFPS